MQRIEVHQDYSKPVEQVYAHLAEHENLGPIFGAKITRKKDGDTSRNGAGSVRTLKLGPLPAFEETVIEAVPNERIVYEITKGSPLRGHHGELHFTPKGTGTHLRYVIEFGAVVPGLDRVIKLGLERSMRKGLPQVEQKA